MSGHILCTPASSGLSLALARHFLQTTRLPMFATARRRRDFDEVLSQLSAGPEQGESGDGGAAGKPDVSERVTMLELDFTKVETLAAAAESIKKSLGKEDYLRLVTVTPGVLIRPEKSPSQIDLEDATRTLQINTLGPMLAMKHFSDFLPPRRTKLPQEEGLPDVAVWATMSARVGSIGDNRLGGWYAYRASKAATNQLTKTFDNHLRQGKRPAVAVALHPGTVKTNLSRDFWRTTDPKKLFDPDFSASKLGDVIRGVDADSGGKIFDWKGEQIPY